MLRGEYVARQCGLWLCASAACIQTVFDPFLLLDVVSGPCSGRAAPVPGEDLVPGGRRPVRAKGVHRAPAPARAGPSSSSNRLHGPSRLQIGGRAGIAGTRCPRAPAPRRGRRFRRLRAHGSPARRQCGERGGKPESAPLRQSARPVCAYPVDFLGGAVSTSRAPLPAVIPQRCVAPRAKRGHGARSKGSQG